MSSNDRTDKWAPPLYAWLVPAAMLVIAVLPLPYVYYNLLRLVVCGAAIWLTFYEIDTAPDSPGKLISIIGGVAIALLFNPVVPFYMGKEEWIPVDLFVAAAFIAHLAWCRAGLRASNTGERSE